MTFLTNKSVEADRGRPTTRTRLAAFSFFKNKYGKQNQNSNFSMSSKDQEWL